jgi:two-component system, NtrC family, sensor histidine kinase HydH
MESGVDGRLDDLAAHAGIGTAQRGKRLFNLLRWFSIISLVAIIIVGSFVGWILTRYLTAQMLLRDAEVSREFLESIATTEKTRDYLQPFAPPPPADALMMFVGHLPALPDVVRANLYAYDRTILWSTESRIVGQKFEANDELDRAFTGEIVIESGRLAIDQSKPEHVGLAKKAAETGFNYFVETYLPIRDKSGQKVLAVVEIYKFPRALIAAIDEGVFLVWMTSAGSGLCLYLAFFGIVRRGDMLLREQRERLVEAEMLTTIGEMAATIAHSIRNPLASIRSAAELAREEDRRGTDECLNDIMSETDRLDNWIRTLLLASRRALVDVEQLDLNDLIHEILDGNSSELRRRNIKLTFSAAALPQIHGSRAMLGHALGNIVANAVQSIPTHGKLNVETLRVDDVQVQVVVEDTGLGMSPTAARNAFRPFFTTKPNGVGLGMSLAKRILDRHGGTITLESAQGRGTKVVITLPLQGS